MALSQLERQYMIDALTNAEVANAICDAIDSGGGGGGGGLTIGTTPVVGGINGRMLITGGGGLLNQVKPPLAGGNVGDIQTNNGSGGWSGSDNFRFDGSVVTYTGTSVNNANFAGMFSTVTVNDTSPPGNGSLFSLGATMNVADSTSHVTDNIGGAYFEADYNGTNTLGLLAGCAFVSKNHSGGTVSQQYGLFGQVVNSGAGTTTSAFGAAFQVRNTGAGVINNATGATINLHDNNGGANIHGGVGVVVFSNGVSMVGFETALTGTSPNIHFFIKAASVGDIGLSADVNGVTNLVREMQFMNQGAAQFWDNTNTFSVSLRAPNAVSGGSYSLSLPVDQGSGALSNDGAGNLSWVAIPGAEAIDQFAYGGTYTLTSANYWCAVNSGSGATTFNLPTGGGAVGNEFVISDVLSQSMMNAITVDAGVGNTITKFGSSPSQTQLLNNNGQTLTFKCLANVAGVNQWVAF